MDALQAVEKAREILAQITPLRTDCGRYCGGACCQCDEDGQGGMLLFPGEEALYQPLPEGFSIVRDDSVTENGKLLICDGECDRETRPLACRLFPMLPKPAGAKMDRRAWAVYPLMEGGKAGLSREFVAAVEKAGRILFSCPEHVAFLQALDDYMEKLKQF